MQEIEARAAASFLDSNVVIYLLSADSAKAGSAQALLKARPVISVQVLNEVAHVCTRKMRMDWNDVEQLLALVRRFCRVVPLTEDIHDLARQIAQRNGLSFYDACIVAAATTSGCRTLYSEDMNHGQAIGNLTIRNPFGAA